MPRMTRAALRSMEQQDGSELTASPPLPQTPIKGRVPLGEVAGNRGTDNEGTSASDEQVTPAKKETGKGQIGNNAKKANKQAKDKAEEVRVEILEDENQSVSSSAAEDARQDLLKDGSQGMLYIIEEAFGCAVTDSCWIL